MSGQEASQQGAQNAAVPQPGRREPGSTDDLSEKVRRKNHESATIAELRGGRRADWRCQYSVQRRLEKTTAV